MQNNPAALMFKLPVDQTSEVEHLIVPEVLHVSSIRRGRHERRMPDLVCQLDRRASGLETVCDVE